jgi:hypothetical protein
VLFFVRQAAKQVQDVMGHEVEVAYAGDLVGPGAIHPSIWAHIKQADVVVADLTGYNPNVVYELGATAAWRPIETVIMLRDRSDGQDHAFDLAPARQRIYDSRQMSWMAELSQWLVMDLWAGLIQAPFHDEPPVTVSLPLDMHFGDGKDYPSMWSPGPGHRRLVRDGLEFGSVFHYPYSWVSPAGLRVGNARVRANMRFSERGTGESWIGIALRVQGYLANYQHLVWLSSRGKVMRTGPNRNPNEKDEHELDAIQGFDPSRQTFYPFDVSIDTRRWSMKVGKITRQDIPVSDLPYVYGPGRVMLRTFNCRAVVRDVNIKAL